MAVEHESDSSSMEFVGLERVVDLDALQTDCPFEEDDILHKVLEIFVSTVQSRGDIRKTFTTRMIIRSLRRAVTDDERLRVAEIMKWFVIQSNILSA